MNSTMKKCLCITLITLLCFTLFSCNEIIVVDEVRQNEMRYRALRDLELSWFLLRSEWIEVEEGVFERHFYERQEARRLIEMYNFIIRSTSPDVLFNGRDIVFEDVFESPFELVIFILERDDRLNGLMVDGAVGSFRRAWNNGYIDHDDVDGCWRGNGDWSEAIDEMIAEVNE